MNKIVIGTRESKLAMVQTNMVAKIIQNHHEVEVELCPMKTTGDIILDKSLDKIGGKGLFVKELDMALLQKKTDISVHSLKDMPMEVPAELPIIAYSKREDPRDVLILPRGSEELNLRKPIGCSSKRRILQVSRIFPGAEFRELRGNILTRIDKLDSGEYGGIILAAAGLKRLGLEDRISRYFTTEEIIPSAGQGVLAIQGRSDFDLNLIREVDDSESRQTAICERSFVRTLDGGCSSPIAAFATVSNGTISLRGLYYDENKEEYKTGMITGDAAEAMELGVLLANRLKCAGEE